MLVGGFTKAIQAGSMALAGISYEDDEDLRKFQPHWSENSDFGYIPSDKRGEYRMIDVTRMNPFGLWHKTGNALLSGDSIGDSILEAGKELFSPFYSPTISLQTAFNAAKLMGEDSWIEAGPSTQREQLANVVLRGYEPGGVTSLRKLYLAAGDKDISESDRSLNFTDELISQFGTRPLSRNIGKAIMFKGLDYQRAIRNVSKKYNSMTRKRGFNQQDINAAYLESEEGRRAAFAKLLDMKNSAIRLGITEKEIRTRWKDEAHMSAKTIRDIFKAAYRPLKRKGFDAFR